MWVYLLHFYLAVSLESQLSVGSVHSDRAQGEFEGGARSEEDDEEAKSSLCSAFAGEVPRSNDFGSLNHKEMIVWRHQPREGRETRNNSEFDKSILSQ